MVYFKNLIDEAIENSEIPNRLFVNQHIYRSFTPLFAYILKVWIKDTSKDYQLTDAAIEKSTGLLFDLVERGPLDSIIDFAKFTYQQKAF